MQHTELITFTENFQNYPLNVAIFIISKNSLEAFLLQKKDKVNEKILSIITNQDIINYSLMYIA